MAKKLGSLDTNKMYASLFGGPQEAAEEQKPEKESEKRLEAETQEEPKAVRSCPVLHRSRPKSLLLWKRLAWKKSRVAS